MHRQEISNDINWTSHSCQRSLDQINRETAHSTATKMFFSETDYIFMQFENFKFHLRWDYDEPALCTHYCILNGNRVSLDLMAKLKVNQVDILKCFAEDSIIHQYEPSNYWRMSCDFQKVLETLDVYGDRHLAYSELKTQR